METIEWGDQQEETLQRLWRPPERLQETGGEFPETVREGHRSHLQRLESSSTSKVSLSLVNMVQGGTHGDFEEDCAAVVDSWSKTPTSYWRCQGKCDTKVFYVFTIEIKVPRQPLRAEHCPEDDHGERE